MPGIIDLSNKDKKVIIVGGGLVGCLAACYFAERKFQVTLYEYRPDIRKMKVVAGRSINMAISVRGREALRQIGAEEAIVSKGIEMYSRMLHDQTGKMTSVPYGTATQSILSIDRRFLNEILLNEAEKYNNVEVIFNQKLIKCDTVTGKVDFKNQSTNESVTEQADLIIGCDGSHSVVRQSLLKQKPINYSEEYISSYYLELTIPPKNGTFAIPSHHLHIWPRGNFMLIALPNQDFSFTCTLFMPLEKFNKINNREQIIDFFNLYFIDALNLIGSDELVESWMSSKPCPLMTIKCEQHHNEKCVLFGDSAHAMVPFFGQGMNCGFQDCEVFFKLFDENNGLENLSTILDKYSEARVPDAKAICDMALGNFVEMSHAVTTKRYMIRKKIDGLLNAIFPNYWIPLYTMVSFTNIRYSEIVKRKITQDKILQWAGVALFSSVTILGYSFLMKFKYL